MRVPEQWLADRHVQLTVSIKPFAYKLSILGDIFAVATGETNRLSKKDTVTSKSEADWRELQNEKEIGRVQLPASLLARL